MSPPASQKMARINVEADAWTALRVEALHRGISVADYLGHLITREADRVARRNTRRHERGNDQPDDQLDGDDVIDLDLDDDDADPIPPPPPLPPSRSDWVPPWEP